MQRLCWMALVLVGLTASPAWGQQGAPADTADTSRAEASAPPAEPATRFGGTTREGRAVLADWPRSLSDLRDRMGRRAPYLLPKLDTLSVRYAYETGTDAVRMQFTLGWASSRSVLYRGELLPPRQAPQDIRMTSVELLLDVVRGGQPLAEIVVAVDTLALRSFPDTYTFNAVVPYDRVFLDTPADSARAYLERGVELRRPTVERIGFDRFVEGEPVGDARPQRGDRTEAPEPAPPPRVYEPRTTIAIGWRVAPRPYYIVQRDGRTVRRPPEEDRTVTRTDDAEGRTSRTADGTDDGTDDAPRSRTGDARDSTSRTGDSRTSDRGDGRARSGRTGDGDESDAEKGNDAKSDEGKSAPKRSDDDDDEDEDSLAPAALGAAAVIAGVAYFGGTVGVYGTGDTPIGLTAGVTRAKGGIHMQAAVNPEVIEQEDRQRLTVKVMGFYDVFNAPIQPAAAVGLRLETFGDDTQSDPSVSFGLVGNTGRIVLYGGYDVVHSTAEFGLTYNFRYSPE